MNWFDGHSEYSDTTEELLADLKRPEALCQPFLLIIGVLSLALAFSIIYGVVETIDATPTNKMQVLRVDHK